MRGLAVTAALLGVLVVACGLLLLHRLGHLAPPERYEFAFENPTLAVPRGQRVVIRPMVEAGAWRRYTFLVTVEEPEPDDPVYPAPHLRAGVEERGQDGVWYRLPPPEFVQPLALGQLGAASVEEWLIELGPVREVSPAGGDRILLRALFGHSNGSSVAYLHDPQGPVPAFGWVRQEVHVQGHDPQVHFARDGGRVEVSPR